MIELEIHLRTSVAVQTFIIVRVSEFLFGQLFLGGVNFDLYGLNWSV